MRAATIMQRQLFYVWFVLLSILTACSSASTCPATVPRAGDPCVGDVVCNSNYVDRCNQEFIAVSCKDGTWLVDPHVMLRACPSLPVKEGDPCPCAGDGQSSPCVWVCAEGGSGTAVCDPTTLKWRYSQSLPAQCTVAVDAGTTP
jgi:hypothetical protein